MRRLSKLTFSSLLIAACSFTGPPGASIDGGMPDVPDATPDVPIDVGPVTLTFRRGLGDVVVEDAWPFEEDAINKLRGQFVDFGWDPDRSEMAGPAGEAFGLLRFDFIGGGADRVPPFSVVDSAILYLTFLDGGDGATVGPALIDWNESATWVAFGAIPGVDLDVDYTETDSAEVAETENAFRGEQAVDVTASVAAWVSAVRPARGWLFRANDTNGVRVHSSDSVTEAARPRLEVTFVPPTQ